MVKKILWEALSAILPVFLIIFVSCGEDEGFDFSKGRKVYMSGNVAFQIIFPETRDTVSYRDSTSGFTSWIQNDALYLRDVSVKDDSLTFHDRKYYLSFDVSFTDTYLREAIGGVRELGCGGEAKIALDTLKAGKMTPLKVSPITGFVDENTIQLFSGLLPEEEQPYIVMRSAGKRIR